MRCIKVIGIGSKPEETQFGTCELCFSYGVANNPYMVLEFPDGTQVTVETHNCISKQAMQLLSMC